MSITKLALKFAAPLPKLEKQQRFLFAGPHPDDIEIGAGATAAKLADMGKDVCFLICIDGRYGDGSAPSGMRLASGPSTSLWPASASRFPAYNETGETKWTK